MTRSLFFVLSVFVPVHYLSAQTTLHRLTVGDTMPDITFDSILNYTDRSARLSDFKDRLIILDQWNTGCGSCIASFPYLDSLQKEFQGQIQVLLYNVVSRQTGDNAARIHQSITRLEQRIGYRLSMAVIYDNDTLDAFFPCRAIPEQVWIRKGRVVAITNPFELTRSNIRQVLAGSTPKLHIRKDQLDFSAGRPLFIDNNGGTGTQTLQRSLLTRYVDGITGGEGVFTVDDPAQTGKLSGCYVINVPLISLLRFGWPDSISTFENRIINRSSFAGLMTAYDDTALYNNAFCYELITPPVAPETLHRLVQEDLRRYFPLHIINEVMSRPCWVLKTDTLRRHRGKKRPAGEERSELFPAAKHKYMHNFSHRTAVRVWTGMFSLPFIDETGNDDPFTIDFPDNMDDMDEMVAAFKTAGYLLAREDRPIKVTIIADN